MAIVAKRRWRSRQHAAILSADIALCLLCCVPVINTKHNILNKSVNLDLKVTRRLIEKQLAKTLQLDKGSGCMIPKLDPFSFEATQYDVKRPHVQCEGEPDWVNCFYSRCKVVEEIKETVKGIECDFQDIVYVDDFTYSVGLAVFLHQEEEYVLRRSDHVKVSCKGTSLEGNDIKWSGHKAGFRDVKTKTPPPGRESTFNVLIFAFDSTARNGFIRRMPKSWKVLTEELGATVMEGYNIVGEGTSAAMFPVLTGHTELELPNARKIWPRAETLDSFPFIFYKLQKDGYRTAYFEDMPLIGTFQWRLKGWRRQPVNHYLRAFLMEKERKNSPYCVGTMPLHKLMMNITEQFMDLDGKRFALTFIGQLTHDDFNMLQTADEDMAAFLRAFKALAEDTLLVVMGDHGPRYRPNWRTTLQLKFEERQPLMALRLPTALVRDRPTALAALQANARALTTPHDLHATLLDVLEMTQHRNQYRVPGADLPRALTMLEPIPRNRSCSEAGIELEWCACVTMKNVPAADPLYNKAAHKLLGSINIIVNNAWSHCVPRTLQSIEWVRRERPTSQLLAFAGPKDFDGFTSRFETPISITEDKYHVKIVVDPGREVYEGSLTYFVRWDQFIIKPEDIFRASTAEDRPLCKFPALFCHCRF